MILKTVTWPAAIRTACAYCTYNIAEVLGADGVWRHKVYDHLVECHAGELREQRVITERAA